MKIKTRLLLTLYVFGLVIFSTTVYLWITFNQVEHLNRQESIARDIDRKARELSYQSNDFLLNREEPQRLRWQSTIDSLSKDLDSIEVNSPEIRVLVEQIQANRDHLQSVFDDVSRTIENSPDLASNTSSLAFTQVAWSRLEVQNQSIIFNTALLAQNLLEQEDRVQQTTIVLIFVLVALIGAFVLTTYLTIYRRILPGLDTLRRGTRIIGSGNLSFSIEDNHKDEFGEVASAFNLMTSNLRQITASKADLEREVNERAQVEEALRRSQARLSRLVDANLIGVFTRDAAGQVTDANEAFLSLIGANMGDLSGGSLNLLDLALPEERETELRSLQEIARGGDGRPREKIYVARDGRQVPVMVGETPAGERASAEWIGFVLDLSELKQAQAALANYAEKLQQSNQELEQFAFIASHDLQEPLRKIKSFSDMLERRAGDRLDPEHRDLIDRMVKATERMQAMISGLLELSRAGRRKEPFVRVSLAVVADEVLSDLETRILSTGGKVEVTQLPEIDADPMQMHQLLQNLIGNALKYHRPDAPPLVKVWCSEAPARWNSAASVTISVADNGIGFEEEYLERIFRPFARLHGRTEYEGTGMGLAICKKIVERHGGSITARSRPGEGSTFIVTLPARQPGG